MTLKDSKYIYGWCQGMISRKDINSNETWFYSRPSNAPVDDEKYWFLHYKKVWNQFTPFDKKGK